MCKILADFSILPVMGQFVIQFLRNWLEIGNHHLAEMENGRKPNHLLRARKYIQSRVMMMTLVRLTVLAGQSTDPFSAEQDKRTDEAGGRDTTGQIAFSGVSITIISITIVSITIFRITIISIMIISITIVSITIFTTISMLIINTILTIVNSVKSIPISILNHRCCLFNHNCCLLSTSTKTGFT